MNVDNIKMSSISTPDTPPSNPIGDRHNHKTTSSLCYHLSVNAPYKAKVALRYIINC